ncbi:helix-turn-helix transcriptional regulator [Hymenobacter psychrotolerans]|nr:YafY family protein [Hymenobacter psychrotolerans]
MNRFDRVTAILIQLQARRKVSGATLAEQFRVSVRTIYRDLRTLEEAGVPLLGEPGVGYSLAEGYRLPPVMFTREEATALLTAEKLAARLTDAPTAQLSTAAMDKVRAVLRRPDRDHLDHLAPHIQVLGPRDQAGRPPAYQQLGAAIAMRRVVRLRYQTAENEAPTTRDVEPISLLLSRHWHLVAYCRLRQTIRNFRLDRILGLEQRTEEFAARPALLQEHWATEARRRPREQVVLRFLHQIQGTVDGALQQLMVALLGSFGLPARRHVVPEHQALPARGRLGPQADPLLRLRQPHFVRGRPGGFGQLQCSPQSG